jgi:predicted metal-binding transcription factor (methanogenesis marker protein 9)
MVWTPIGFPSGPLQTDHICTPAWFSALLVWHPTQVGTRKALMTEGKDATGTWWLTIPRSQQRYSTLHLESVSGSCLGSLPWCCGAQGYGNHRDEGPETSTVTPTRFLGIGAP